MFNGSYSGAAGITTSLRIGNASTSVSSATYYINGNNSALTDGNTADISRGIVYVGNSNALGSSVVRVGNGSAVNDSVQLLTNGAVAVVNNLQIWTASTNTTTIGGGTADQSSFTGSVNMASGAKNYSLKVTAVSGGVVNFSNVLTDGSYASSLEKVGAGTVRLGYSTGNTYDGGTTVSVGTLLASSSSNSSTGTGAVSVASGATLGGSGRIAPNSGKQ